VTVLRFVSIIMRAQPLLFFAPLLDRYMVSDCIPGNRPDNRVMMRQVTGNTADNSALEASCLSARDIGGAHSQNHEDHKGNFSHLSLLEVIAVSASPYTGGSLCP
jgi:hypothetical protein